MDQDKKQHDTEEHTPETPPAATDAETPGKDSGTMKETLYDKIPLTYKQVDIAVKVLIALAVLAVVVGMIVGRG